MNITQVTDFNEIYLNKDIADLLGTAMFNPTFGKIQNVAQSIYAKTQGRFYACYIESVLVGVIGLSKIDNDKLIIKHIAVSSTFKRQKIASTMLDFIIERERVDVVEAETDDDAVSFYKGYGFSIKKLPYNDATGQRYQCIYEVK